MNTTIYDYVLYKTKDENLYFGVNINNHLDFRFLRKNDDIYGYEFLPEIPKFMEIISVVTSHNFQALDSFFDDKINLNWVDYLLLMFPIGEFMDSVYRLYLFQYNYMLDVLAYKHNIAKRVLIEEYGVVEPVADFFDIIRTY